MQDCYLGSHDVRREQLISHTSTKTLRIWEAHLICFKYRNTLPRHMGCYASSAISRSTVMRKAHIRMAESKPKKKKLVLSIERLLQGNLIQISTVPQIKYSARSSCQNAELEPENASCPLRYYSMPWFHWNSILFRTVLCILIKRIRQKPQM